MTTIYPCDYDDELKSIYDDLYSRGKQLIGTKLKANEEYLLDISAKMTINQMRGIDNGLSVDEIDNIRKIHKQNMSGTFETPPELYYDGLMRTSDGTSVVKHPLMVSEEEMYEKHRQPPKNVITNGAIDEEHSGINDVDVLTKQVGEMLEIN